MSTTTELSKPSLIFLGTPDFAVPSLEALVKTNAYTIHAVITQPDKPAGRGQRLTSPAIKNFACEHSLPVFQPVSLKKLQLIRDGERSHFTGSKSSAELAEFLNSIAPIDVGISVAYGKIIPSSLLAFPHQGVINVHPSLLPRWRGAAPLQRALFYGDDRTGVTIMKVDDGLDTGPIYSMEELPIEPDETMGSLHEKLAELGARMLVRCLPDILEGKLKAETQPETGATYAEKWDHEDLVINWAEPAEITLRRIRTCAPYPGARTALDNIGIKIYSAHQVSDQNFARQPPGTVVEANRAELIVSAGSDEYIALDEMQFPGKKRLPTPEILRGKKIKVGDRFE